MIFLLQILRKPQNVSAWHSEKSGHDTLSMYKRACPRLGLSYLTPNGSTRLFQIIIWTLFQNVTSFWCTVLIWPDCPRTSSFKVQPWFWLSKILTGQQFCSQISLSEGNLVKNWRYNNNGGRGSWKVNSKAYQGCSLHWYGPSYTKICYRRLISRFSDLLQEIHCLFLGSITWDYCLFMGSLYSEHFSLINYFIAEGGHQLIVHPEYSV